MSDKKPPDKLLQAIELKERNPQLQQKEIASIVGCSPAYISRELKRLGFDFKHVQTFKQLKADILAAHQSKVLEGITEEDIKKASLKDKAIAFGVLSDKEKQERDKTTVKELFADVVERLAKERRKTTITIEETVDNIIPANIIEAEEAINE